MRIKQLQVEDFVNYRKPSMFIGTCLCDWKCCTEQGLDIKVCQNEPLAKAPIKTIDDHTLLNYYLHNDITEAIVIGGLEPMKQFDEVLAFVRLLRQFSFDDVVIYTGYYPNEIESQINQLKQFPNIYLKCGRYTPNSPKRYDEVLGITLVSENQYGVKIS